MVEEEELEKKLDDIKALNKVLDAFESSKRNQQVAFNLFKELYQLWKFYKASDSSVKVFVPVGYAQAISLLSKLFVKTPKILAYARDREWKEGGKMVSGLLEYQFDNPTADEPIDEQYISFLTELFICGTSIAKVVWDTNWITQYYEDETGKRIPEKKKGFDDPIFEHIPIEDVFFQAGATNIYNSKYIIFRKLVDKSYLREKEKQGIYKNIDEVEGQSQAKTDELGIKQTRTARSKGGTAEATKDKIELLEYWEEDRLIAVANRETIIRNEDNPFNHGKKPFIMMQYIKTPHEFYGVGVFEPIKDLHRVINITMTQRLEYITNLLNQQYGVVGQNVDEEAIIEGYPVVHMDTPSDVFPLNKGTIPQPVFMTANEINAEIERVGISGYSSGAPIAPSDKTMGTKGGVQAIIAEAQTKFNMTLTRFEKQVLKKTAQLFLDLDKQYLPETEEKIIMLNSKQGKYSMPFVKQILEMAAWQIEIVPGSVGYMDKQAKFENFLRFVEFAEMRLPNFDRNAAVMEAADYLEIDEPERFLMPMPEGLPSVPGGMPEEPTVAGEMPEEPMPI